MLSVTSKISSSQAPTSNRFLNKKAIILAAGALLLCISGVTIAVLFFNTSESTSDSGRIVTDAQNQAASIKASNSLASDATDTPGVKLAAFDKIKHHVATNPVRTAAIVLAVVAVLVGIIVTAVLISTSGEEIESVIPPDPADSETENGTEGHQTDDSTTIEETGLSESAKIVIGVGAAAALLIILFAVTYFKQQDLKTCLFGPVSGSVNRSGSDVPVTENVKVNGTGTGPQTTKSDSDKKIQNNDREPSKKSPPDVQADINNLGKRSENEAQPPPAQIRFESYCSGFSFVYSWPGNGRYNMEIFYTRKDSVVYQLFKFLPESGQDDPLYQNFDQFSGMIIKYDTGTPQKVFLPSITGKLTLILNTKDSKANFKPHVPELKVEIRFELDKNQQVTGMAVRQIKSQ